LDALNEQLSVLSEQRMEFQGVIDQLEKDLEYERARRDSDVIETRQEWIETWNQAYPFLPQVSKEDPDCTLDSIGIMRLALQHSRPKLNLDSLIENAKNPMDAIKTAFSMMVTEGDARRSPYGSPTAMNYLINSAKADDYNFDSTVTKDDRVNKLTEAWRVRN
jgi:hypothetical protein